MPDSVNFTKNYSKNCSKLLRSLRPEVWTDRKVTILLAIASSGLAFPVERFEYKDHHSPIDEWKRFPKAQLKFIRLMVEKFFGSILLPEPPGSWTFVWSTPLSKQDVAAHNDTELPPRPPSDILIYDLMKHIRTAFGHGVVYAQGRPLSKLAFLASVREEKNESLTVAVSPDDLKDFLCRWFEFLETLDFPVGSDTIDAES